MLRNFACPKVFMYDNHACVSLRDLLDHKLADGTSFDFVQDHLGVRSRTGLNGTPEATKLLEDMIRDNKNESTNCAFGYLILWSDGFLRCFSRQRENSIWLLVVRICPPHKKNNGDKHTHCIAMGRGKDAHDKVVDRFLREIREIRQGRHRYYAKIKRKIYTFFDLLMYVADTPERNKLLHTLDGGTYGLRSLFAGRINADLLPSCAQCFRAMLDNAAKDGPIEHDNVINPMGRICHRCCNFEMTPRSGSSNALTRRYDTNTAGYPTTCDNTLVAPAHRTVNQNNICPYEITFQWLIQGVKFAFH